MSFHDHLKLGLLLFCFLACLSSLWTSPSFELGTIRVPTLAPNLKQWCKNQTIGLRECHKKEGDSSRDPNHCKDATVTLQTCENVIRKAYRYINLGGCLVDNQMLARCRSEWCEEHGQQKHHQLDCEKECALAKRNLDQCIERVVTKYL